MSVVKNHRNKVTSARELGEGGNSGESLSHTPSTRSNHANKNFYWALLILTMRRRLQMQPRVVEWSEVHFRVRRMQSTDLADGFLLRQETNEREIGSILGLLPRESSWLACVGRIC